MKAVARSLILGAALLAVPTCGDDASVVGPLDGRIYRLVTVNGEELPYAFRSPQIHIIRWIIRSDEIQFEAGDRWSRVQRWTEELNGVPGEHVLETEGEVRREGGDVVLWYECRDQASCVAPDRLRELEGGRLLMERPALWSGASNLVFVPLLTSG